MTTTTNSKIEYKGAEPHFLIGELGNRAVYASLNEILQLRVEGILEPSECRRILGIK